MARPAIAAFRQMSGRMAGTPRWNGGWPAGFSSEFGLDWLNLFVSKFIGMGRARFDARQRDTWREGCVAMLMPRVIGVFLACLVTPVFAIAKTPEKHTSHHQGARMRAARTCQFGKAGRYVLLGRKTASGEMLDSVTATAAHRSLPLTSFARVTDLDNGRSVIVKINDRGPYTRGRIIDLSPRAADALDMKAAGVAAVVVEPVSTLSKQTIVAAQISVQRQAVDATTQPGFSRTENSSRQI